jgi:methanogenic corrinoid protein MtbC1
VAAIAMLLLGSDVEAERIGRVCVWGASGRPLNVASAQAVGLLPDLPAAKVHRFADATPDGCEALLLSQEGATILEKTASGLSLINTTLVIWYEDRSIEESWLRKSRTTIRQRGGTAMRDVIKAYNDAVFETDKDAAFRAVDEALERGMTPEDIVFEVVIPAVEEMMTRIARDPDANLAQHFMTAQIASEVTEKMLERFAHSPEIIGKVVIGTAYGDLHSLGKRIVMGCLKALMVDVVDLGVNVPAERFVDEARNRDAQVIAISAMMVHTANGPQGCIKVRQLLQEQGLADRIRIAVGGAPYRFDGELYRAVGADAYATDGVTAGRVIIELIHQVKRP